MAETVETVKEERPTIALSCNRKVVQAVLKTTGLAIFAFHGRYQNYDSNIFVFPSENWILPIFTLGVMVVYAALAIFFYNSDG